MKNIPLLTIVLRTLRTRWLILLAALCISQLSLADGDWDAEGERRAKNAGAGIVGQMAPAATLTTIDGQPINFANLIGKKPIYLKFWATWCVPCRQQMPGFVEIYKEFGDSLEMIAVNTGFADDITAIRAYRKEHQLPMPIVIDDGSLGSALHLRVTPQHVVIDRRGVITHVSHLDNEELHQALNDAVADQHQVPDSTTKVTELKAYKVGDKVRDLELKLLDGTQIDLAKAPHKQPRALVFFAPWCEWYLENSRPGTSKACERVLNDAERLLQQTRTEWLGVSSGLWVSESDLVDYQNTSKRVMPLAHDAQDALFRAFGIRDIPSVVLLDTEGRVAKVLGPDDTALEAAIAELKSVTTN